MKNKLLKTLSVVALLGAGVIGTVSCGGDINSNDTSSDTKTEDTKPAIISEDGLTSIDIGQTLQLSVENVTGKISWKSKNTGIATVDENGLVTGVNEGEVEITARVDGQTLTIKLTITDPEADIKGKVIISEELPSEIIIGTDNALDLDTNDYVTVTKVNRWTLTTESDTVEIVGHKIIGVDYGPFLVTLKAGATRRAIEGYVVSPDKAKFNGFIDSIGNNFIVANSITGTSFVTENYYANFDNVNDTETEATFTGAVINPNDNYSYPFELTMPITNNMFDEEKATLTMKEGYGRTPKAYGYDSFNSDGNMGGAKFTEVIVQGEPAGYYLLQDEAVGEYDTVLSLWYDRVAPGSYYYFNTLVKQATKNEIGGLVAVLGSDESFASFFPVDTSGQIVQAINYNGQTLSLGLQIADVGTTSIKAVETWIKNPTIPEQIDISDLTTFLTNVTTTKKYTLEGSAKWVDADGKAAACPDGFKFDGGVEVLPTFETVSYVNENAVYNKVISANSIYDVGMTTPAAGTIDLSITKNNVFYSASGTVVDGVDTLNAAEADADATLTDIWQDGSILTVGSLLLDPEEDGKTLLSMASFYEKTVDENGTTTYGYNLYGPDAQYGLGEYWPGLQGFSTILVNYNLGFITTFWFGAQGWSMDGANMSFALNNEKTELTFTMSLDVSNNLQYIFGWTIKNVGTDAMPEVAKTIIENL